MEEKVTFRKACQVGSFYSVKVAIDQSSISFATYLKRAFMIRGNTRKFAYLVATMRYIAYYRVSTQKQGRSGLGLDDQRHMVQRFLRAGEELIQEFTEIESGRKKERPKLQAAILAAKQHDARLLIAKLDRLSRNASFVMVLRDSEVDFVACDLPDANTLTIGIMASFAQHEAEQISKRTRAALAQKKARGFTLGKPENLTDLHRAKGVQVIQENARIHAANRQAAELIRLYQRDHLSLREIAQRLNEHGFRTRYGKRFQSETVRRILKRAEPIPDQRINPAFIEAVGKA